MRMIILAAGRGSRLGYLTNDTPKCMLKIDQRTILDYQIELARSHKIKDIIVITGYKNDLINKSGIKKIVNKSFLESNMVFSLSLAASQFNDDIIISYGDIIYDLSIFEKTIQFSGNIGVAIDENWYSYYSIRFKDPYYDAESLVLDKDKRIIEIGNKNPNPSSIQGQYIGLIKLNKIGASIFKKILFSLTSEDNSCSIIRDRTFNQLYLTDFLQYLIKKQIDVYAIPVQNGWVEFDTSEDYLKFKEWQTNGTLEKLLHIKLN